MISLLEVAERARSGSKLTDKEWGLALFKKLQELIIKHELKQESPERFYEVDNEYADSLFQAAVDLLSELGIYCTHTKRTIKFTEDEIREALREVPSSVKIGEGRDQRVWQKRSIKDKKRDRKSITFYSCWPDRGQSGSVK